MVDNSFLEAVMGASLAKPPSRPMVHTGTSKFDTGASIFFRYSGNFARSIHKKVTLSARRFANL